MKRIRHCVSNYFAVLFEVYQSLEEDQRISLRDCLAEVILNQHRGRQIMLTLPEDNSWLHLK
jgi:hypothetical protein